MTFVLLVYCIGICYTMQNTVLLYHQSLALKKVPGARARDDNILDYAVLNDNPSNTLNPKAYSLSV